MRLLRSRAQKKHPRHGPGQASAEPRRLSLRPLAPTCITLPRPDSMAGNHGWLVTGKMQWYLKFCVHNWAILQRKSMVWSGLVPPFFFAKPPGSSERTESCCFNRASWPSRFAKVPRGMKWNYGQPEIGWGTRCPIHGLFLFGGNPPN